MLKINQLQVSYTSHLVLDDLQLDFHEGEIHGILGMNGSGKTTFFNSVYGRLKRSNGTIEFRGKELEQGAVAYLETEDFFYSFMKGREYLNLLFKNADNTLIDEWNELFQLPLNEFVDNYSTGMKKKLSFLGCIALDRPILILDEPFNGIDLESSEVLYQILSKLKTKSKTILLSSHILHSLTSICDRISYLDQKKIQYTYPQNEFPVLEDKLKELIHQKIGGKLDVLLDR